MSVQKYIVSKQSSNYTTIPNKIIKGLQGELELLGLYLYLLSLPPAWEFHKKQLRDNCNIGINKLDKYLSRLSEIGLVQIYQVRVQNGRFSHFDLTVLNGDSFKIKDIDETVQPFNENGANGSGGTVPVTYKRKKEKRKRTIKEINKNSCSSIDEHQTEFTYFDTFWSFYPRKQKKKDAQKIWKKQNIEDIGITIIEDIKLRLQNDWKGRALTYIPLPTTYLNAEGWNDELINDSKPQSKETGMERALRMCTN